MVFLFYIFIFYLILKALGSLFDSSSGENFEEDTTLRFEISFDDFDEEPIRKSNLTDDGNRFWVTKGKVAKVGKWEIPNGMVYIGENLSTVSASYWRVGIEPALINPELKIASSNLDLNGETLDYWPSYSELTPQARGAYLSWLSSGADDPQVKIGYVFLYFYGLERRLVNDLDALGSSSGVERLTLLDEVRRLHNIYNKNGSFSRYASNLLAYFSTQDNKSTPQFSNWDNYPSEGEISETLVELGQHAKSGKPIDTSLAMQWLRIGENRNFWFRTPATRCRAEFLSLCAASLSTKYPDGFKIKPSIRTLTIYYRPASASFGHTSVSRQTDLPDVSQLRQPLDILEGIANEATDELDAYSRYLGRHPNTGNNLPALTLLPKILLRQENHREAVQPIIEYLESTIKNESHAVVESTDMLSFWPLQSEDKVKKQEATSIAQLLSKLGYGMEPDVRFGSQVLKPDGKICLFQLSESSGNAPTAEYKSAAVYLKLAALISYSDREIAESERWHMEQYISMQTSLSDDEKTRLTAYMNWLLVEQPGLAGLKKRLEVLAESSAHTLAPFLISVVVADGHIRSEEISMLEKIYKFLQLDPIKVHSDIHMYQTSGLSTIDLGNTKSNTKFDIPKMSVAPNIAGEMADLDEDRIAATLRSTDSVQTILSAIFTEDDNAVVVTDAQEVTDLDGVPGLDSVHLELFHAIKDNATLSIENFESLCSNYGLFSNGALEILNEVAYLHCDEPLIEEGDEYSINATVAKELLECQVKTK